MYLAEFSVVTKEVWSLDVMSFVEFSVVVTKEVCLLDVTSTRMLSLGVVCGVLSSDVCSTAGSSVRATELGVIEIGSLDVQFVRGELSVGVTDV